MDSKRSEDRPPPTSDGIRIDGAEATILGLLESAPDAMLLIDRRGAIIAANKQTEHLFGYPIAELLRQPIEMLVPGRFRDRHPEHRNRYFAEPRIRPMGSGQRLFGRRRDGSEVPVEISLSPIERDGEANVITAIRDVSYRKSAEEKFRALLEAAPDAMVIVNDQGRIVLVNSQTEKVFGYSREEMLGQAVEMLVPVRFRGQHPAYRDEYFKEPRVRPMGMGIDLFALHKNGTEFPVEISLSPLVTEDGVLVSSSIRDVTDRKRFEKALQEKNLELAKASLAKDRFLASMSHELRTPLNAVIGFTGTLLMKLPGPLTAAQEKQLNTIKTNAKHLLSLINDLLDLAKIESGSVELQLEPISCSEVIAEVIGSLRPLAESKGLLLEVHNSLPDLIVRSDRRALSQILLNLTNNAIKFTDAGSVKLTVQRRDNAFRFEITDTGIGIPDDQQTLLFQAYSRVPATGKRREGTGLGLHLSRKLAELLGGEITMKSEFGVGSTFILTLKESP